jgi:hypothetical protein
MRNGTAPAVRPIRLDRPDAPDKLDTARVVHHVLDVIQKELSARIELVAALELRPHSLTKLPNSDIQLGALAKPLCCCNVSPCAFERL